MISRRNFLRGLGAALAAPAVIRTPGLLMPIRALVTDPIDVSMYLTEESAWAMNLNEFTTADLIAKSTARYRVAVSDWRGVYGSTGL